MQNNADNQNKKVAASAVANKKPEAPSQDLMWKRFDAMLQEFLKMEQTSPAVQLRKTAKTV
jgi:hypothetical protein